MASTAGALYYRLTQLSYSCSDQPLLSECSVCTTVGGYRPFGIDGWRIVLPTHTLIIFML